MTEQDKKLLLKDLCARLPYGVIVHSLGIPHEQKLVSYIPDIEHYSIKPYLRPMSSMTEEEKEEYELLANHCIVTSTGFVHLEATLLIDWLNKHHFDVRNLIERGLAIDCTNLNIY